MGYRGGGGGGKNCGESNSNKSIPPVLRIPFSDFPLMFDTAESWLVMVCEDEFDNC